MPLPNFAADAGYKDRSGESNHEARPKAVVNERSNQDDRDAKRDLDDADDPSPRHASNLRVVKPTHSQ